MAKQKANSKPTTAPPAPETHGEYTVVARRYRPQQFTELVGQEPVARALMNAIGSDRVAHAYIFTGARGTGKTSTARILAKALNCEKGPTPTPCDQCETCKGIASGEDIDVLEIDGASNRGIDNVRELRQNVNTRPSRSRYKIYIIDEVQQLTKDAFNALLKTLEEPPPHVKFIFATTEIEKIPITIKSRCQRFDFLGINSTKIAERLKQVVAAEKMQADDEALMLVARRAGGSMRDAQSLLDQLLAFDAERLTVAKVHQILGTATDDRMLALVAAIVEKNAKRVLELLSNYSDEGLQLGELLDQLIEYWRCLMLINCGGAEFADVSLTGFDRDKALQHAQNMTLDTILSGLDILTTTKNRLRGSNYSLVLLEMATLKLIRLDDLVPVAELIQSLKQPGIAASAAKSTRSPQASELSAADAGKKKSITDLHAATTKNAQASPTAQPAASGGDVADLWPRILDTVGPMLKANLEKAGLPAIFAPKSLVLRFESRYTAQCDFCSEPGSVQSVLEALRKVTGEVWFLRVESAANTNDAGSANSAEDVSKHKDTHRERLQEIMKIPLISRAMDKLGATVRNVEDGFGQNKTV